MKNEIHKKKWSSRYLTTIYVNSIHHHMSKFHSYIFQSVIKQEKQFHGKTVLRCILIGKVFELILNKSDKYDKNVLKYIANWFIEENLTLNCK